MTATPVLAPARVVFALLVVACFGAFFLTQRLKHSPTAVEGFMMVPYFVPSQPGAAPTEHLSFRIDRTGDVMVTIVDAAGRVAATLERDYHLTAYRRLHLQWNGRTGSTESGPPAPQGVYRVQVTLLDESDRPVVSLRSFTLVRVPRHPGVVG